MLGIRVGVEMSDICTHFEEPLFANLEDFGYLLWKWHSRAAFSFAKL
jgi:hypothetical protein